MKIILTKDNRDFLESIGVRAQTIRNWVSGRTYPTPHYQHVLTQLTGKNYIRKKKAA